MFTSWLVPLGKDFEMAIGATCSGYGSRTFDDLIGKIDGKERFQNSNQKCSSLNKLKTVFKP